MNDPNFDRLAAWERKFDGLKPHIQTAVRRFRSSLLERLLAEPPVMIISQQNGHRWSPRFTLDEIEGNKVS